MWRGWRRNGSREVFVAGYAVHATRHYRQWHLHQGFGDNFPKGFVAIDKDTMSDWALGRLGQEHKNGKAETFPFH